MTIFDEIMCVVVVSLIVSFCILGIKNLRYKHVSKLIEQSRRRDPITFDPGRLHNALDDVIKNQWTRDEFYKKYVENRQDEYSKRFITVFLYNIQKALENEDVINCGGVYKIHLTHFGRKLNGFDLSKPFEEIVHELEKDDPSRCISNQRYFDVSTWRNRYDDHNDWNPETIKYVSDKLWNEYGIHILNASDLEIAFVRRSEYNNLCPELQEDLHNNDPERFPEVIKGFRVTILTKFESDGTELVKVKSTFYSTKAFAEAYPNGIYPEYSIVEKVYGNQRMLIHHYKDLSPKGEYRENDGS